MIRSQTSQELIYYGLQLGPDQRRVVRDQVKKLVEQAEQNGKMLGVDDIFVAPEHKDELPEETKLPNTSFKSKNNHVPIVNKKFSCSFVRDLSDKKTTIAINNDRFYKTKNYVEENGKKYFIYRCCMDGCSCKIILYENHFIYQYLHDNYDLHINHQIKTIKKFNRLIIDEIFKNNQTKTSREIFELCKQNQQFNQEHSDLSYVSQHVSKLRREMMPPYPKEFNDLNVDDLKAFFGDDIVINDIKRTVILKKKVNKQGKGEILYEKYQNSSTKEDNENDENEENINKRMIKDKNIEICENIDEKFETLLKENKQNEYEYSKETERIVIISTPVLLRIAKSFKEKIIFGDGTFSYVPLFCSQMYTLHVGTESFHCPFLFCFTNSRSTFIYNQMYKFIQDQGMTIEHLISDFEIANILSAKDIFHCNVKGCLFHFQQSLIRKVNTLGLKKEYANKGLFHFIVNLIMSLSILEIKDMANNFMIIIHYLIDQIEMICNKNNEPFEIDKKYKDFIKYFIKIWLGTSVLSCEQRKELFDFGLIDDYVNAREPRFWIELWNHSGDIKNRTNNFCESFHSSFSKRFNHCHPNIYLVITNILSISKDSFYSLHGQTKMLDSSKRKSEVSTIEVKFAESWDLIQNINFEILNNSNNIKSKIEKMDLMSNNITRLNSLFFKKTKKIQMIKAEKLREDYQKCKVKYIRDVKKVYKELFAKPKINKSKVKTRHQREIEGKKPKKR